MRKGDAVLSIDSQIDVLREIAANAPRHQQEWVNGQLILKKNFGRKPQALLELVKAGQATKEQADAAATKHGFAFTWKWVMRRGFDEARK